jgi:PD-(D/E)XK nuclease superfamily
MTDIWPPEGLVRKSAVVTVRLSMFGPERYRCPASDTLKAHGFQPRVKAPWKPEALKSFPEGPFMDAADIVERQADELPPNAPDHGAQSLIHDGIQQWTEHALRSYRETFPADPDLHLAKQPWVYKNRHTADDFGTVEHRIAAWGRFLESTDGRVRELRLPVRRLRARSEVERAVAALVAAEGNADPRVERLNVVQFSLSDGGKDTVFNGTRNEALDLYRADGAPAVRALLNNQEYRPGSACASCAVASVCPALPRAADLLGITDRSRPRRSWSSTTARGHRACPARGYLRSLRLPTADTIERSAAAERGRAIHAFLAENHGRQPRIPCTPEIPADWMPKGFQLSDEERRLGAVLLRHHAEVCPLRAAALQPEIRVEPKLTFDDTAADLVVLAEPDLLYQDAGSWVWRETKTSSSDRPVRNMLAAYPQLALAVAVIGSEVLPSPHTGGRVELELLCPSGVDLHILDPFAPSTRATAAEMLREQVSGWHKEMLFKAIPGYECASCEVAQWCSVRQPQQPGPAVGHAGE